MVPWSPWGLRERERERYPQLPQGAQVGGEVSAEEVSVKGALECALIS